MLPCLVRLQTGSNQRTQRQYRSLRSAVQFGFEIGLQWFINPYSTREATRNIGPPAPPAHTFSSSTAAIAAIVIYHVLSSSNTSQNSWFRRAVVEQRKFWIVLGLEAVTPAVGGIQPPLEQATCPQAVKCYLHVKSIWMAKSQKNAF